MNEAAPGEQMSGPPRRSRLRRWRTWIGILSLIVLVAFAIAWIQREPLAVNFVDAELARLGVEGSYEITDLGFSHQRVENLVIGDPDDPDLTAEWAVLHTRIGFGLPEVVGVTAHGVRLEGELVDGRLRFGQLDRLLPEPTGEPIKLPELFVAVDDAQVRLATPYGPVVLAVAGSGRLDNGFSGHLAAGSPSLAIEGCRARRVRLSAAVTVIDRRPEFTGPLTADRLICPASSIAAVAPRVELSSVFSEAFDKWNGDATISLASLAAEGAQAGPVRGRIEFDGGSELTTGTVALDANRFRLPATLASADAGVLGHYRIDGGGDALAFDGEARFARASVARPRLAGLTGALRGAEGTPLGPAGTRLATAVERAASGFTATLSVTAAVVGERGALWLTGARGRSASGARFVFEDGDGIRYAWPNRGARVDGALTLAGGGFPDGVVALNQDRVGAPLEGVARFAPIVAGGSRLELAPVSFSAGRGGATRIATVLEVSGPLAGGHVERLRMPVRGVLRRGGGLAFGPGCTPLRWARLRVAGLTVGTTELPLCPISGGSLLRVSPGGTVSGGARIVRPRITGTLGSSPLLIAASELRVPLGDPGLAAEDVAVRLGAEGERSLLDIGRIAGSFVAGGVEGRYSGTSGKLYNVPVRLSESEGNWRFVRGVLDLDGAAQVTSATEPDPLFHPLVAPDLDLHLENDLVTLTGSLHAPQSGQVVANVDLRHYLTSGEGDVVLDTPSLSFGNGYELTDLTDILFGIVAEVEGTVRGVGRLSWGREGVASTGDYELVDVDLAAPFGPVEGINTEVHFTDLLGLNTSPGQVATIGGINPGVLVENGVVRYELLSSNRVRVEGARWPFSGGQIILEPSVLDFGVDQVRRLTFRVEGVDALQFVDERQFESLAASGTFDGVLPMVFDSEGGRIEGGYLRSRPGGGSFSYVGEISDVNLGVLGTLAFNALELVRYEEMVLRFDGELTGEMITQVEFTGVAPRISRQGQNFLVAGLTRQLAALPVRFNITMHAPFQGIFYSVRLLDDPSFLVGEAIRRARSQTEAEQAVQASDSGAVP